MSFSENQSAGVGISPVSKRIAAVIDEVHGQELRRVAEQLAQFELRGNHRRFIVTRMGHTGSTWLAKLLNSHPDVLCMHEHIISRIYPSPSFNSDHIVEVIRWLAEDRLHDAYVAAGDVGSTWTAHSAAVCGRFATAVLMRHPARILNTRLRVYPADQSYSEIPDTSRETILRLWDIDVARCSPVYRIFLHDLLTFACQVHLLHTVDVVLRIEDLQNAEYCGEMLERLTTVRYPADMIISAIRRRVNVSASPRLSIRQILEKFSQPQKSWYRTILRDVAPLLGYDPEDDHSVTFGNPAGTGPLRRTAGA